MFSPTITSDLLMDLSTDEQQLLAGGKKQPCGGVSDDGEAFKTQNGGNGNGGGFSAMLCYRITATPSFQCGNGNGEEEGDEGMES